METRVNNPDVILGLLTLMELNNYEKTEEENRNRFISQLPLELLCYMATFLPPKDKARAAQVSKGFKLFADHDESWKEDLTQYNLNQEELEELRETKGNKQIFIEEKNKKKSYVLFRHNVEKSNEPLWFLNEYINKTDSSSGYIQTKYDDNKGVYASLEELKQRLRQDTIRTPVYVLKLNISKEGAESLLSQKKYVEFSNHIIGVHSFENYSDFIKERWQEMSVKYQDGQFVEKAAKPALKR